MTNRPATGGRIKLIILALLAGLVGASGQAPFGIYPLGIAGLAAGFFLIARIPSPKPAALAGWALGTGYFAGTLAWIVQPFLVDAPRYGWMAPFALLFLAAGLALFWGLAAGLARRFSPNRWFWLSWAAWMAAAELLRGIIFTGFPWGGLAMFWVDTPFMGMAGLVGASGMGFLSFALIAGIYSAWVSGTRMRITLVGSMALALGVGAFFDRQDVPERATPVALRLIQPNAPQHLKWHPDYVLSFLERAIALTGDASDTPPDLVIWPESSVPYLLEDAGPVLAEIATVAAPARVVLGIQRRDGQRYYNSLVALDGDGAVAGLYDKHHLVPFGEYTPAGGLLHRFGIKGLAAQYGNGYSAGPGALVLDLGRAGKALPLICYEAIFSRDIAAAPERADWILQATNDAWFGTFSGPQQHLAQARLRAAEFGLPFVRAANTGISAVIDARGHVVASLALGEAGFLDADLPGALPKTIYAKTGDTILILLLIGIIIGLAWSRRSNSV